MLSMVHSVQQTMITVLIILIFISASFQLPLSTLKSSKSKLVTTTLNPTKLEEQNNSPVSSAKKLTMESTTSSPNMVTFVPQYPPNYRQNAMNVLIPRSFPGKFYYPPCKCDLVNQIRYYNPKTKEFYYHKAHTAIPPTQHLGVKTERTRQGQQFQGGMKHDTYVKVPILAGEPEFYPVPALPAKSQAGNQLNTDLPVPALALPYMPSNYEPYINHQMVNHNGPPQGPYMPYPMPPVYNRSLYNERGLYRNPYGGYYTYSTMLDDASGAPEAVLVIAALSLWCYSVYRLYSAWQSTLNFSEASIQGPQGWDLLVTWIAERIRIRNLKVPGITTRRKTEYPVPNSDMISMASQNDTRIVPTFSKVEVPDECIEPHNGVYRMEMTNITDEAVQQIEDLAMSTDCGREGIDIQSTITRIVEGHESLKHHPSFKEESMRYEEEAILFHNQDRNFTNIQPKNRSISNVKNDSCMNSPMSHSLSTEAKETYRQDIVSTYQQYSSLPPSITTSVCTSLPAEKYENVEAPKLELSEVKPSIPTKSVVEVNANAKRARYGRSKTAQFIGTSTVVPTTRAPCSMYMVDETQQSGQEISNQVRTKSDSDFTYADDIVNPQISSSVNSNYTIPPLHRCDPSNDTRQKLLLRKQVSEDVNKCVNMTKTLRNVPCNSNIGLGRYTGPNRSLRSFQEPSKESGVMTRFDFGSMYIRNSYFCSEKNSNSHHLLAADEGGIGNWSSLINYNSSIDSSIRETDYEDRTSPDNAL